jgi:hypothetical protein
VSRVVGYTDISIRNFRIAGDTATIRLSFGVCVTKIVTRLMERPMTRSDFVKALKTQTSDAAFFGTKQNLEQPPGRKPREKDVRLSAWYTSLSDSDRESVDAVLLEAAELAVFSFLCIIDGVSAVENGPDKGELRLQCVSNGELFRLNAPADEPLHDAFNALCRELTPAPPQRSEGRLYETGPFSLLREHQTATDAIDLHTIPSGASRNLVEDPPAISLPKNEHRKL